MPERRVSVGTLKARLSEYLDRAKAGEAVVITDRGKPVARLAPLGGDVAREARVQELARAGVLRVEGRRPLPDGFFRRPLPADREGRSLEAVLEERAEGW